MDKSSSPAGQHTGNTRAETVAALAVDCAAALADHRAYLNTLVPDAVQRATDEARALTLTPPNPLRRAGDHTGIGLNPCPIYAWCMGHEPGEPVTPRSLHYGEAQPVPGASLYLHLDGNIASIATTPDSAHTTLLDPDEALVLASSLISFALAARG